jgi:hypothetical protein
MAQPDACWGTPIQGPEEIAACTEDLTEQQCTDFFDFEFTEEQACTGLDFSWEGACIVTIPDFGSICFLVDPYQSSFDGYEACEFIGGSYQGDGSTCGAPVPTLPAAGRAALILVMLIGALVVLNMHGIIRSG